MLIGLHRIGHWAHHHRIPLVPQFIYVVNRLVFAIAMPPSVQMGRNVISGYRGLGIVIHRRAVIEDDVNVGPGVVIGGRSGLLEVPVIRRGAELGAGAKIIGPVTVGRYAKVGANAVVLSDIPDGGIAVGVPAKVIRIDALPSEASSGSSRSSTSGND